MKKFNRIVLLVAVVLLLFPSVSAYAYTPYKTYTYSYTDHAEEMPSVYVTEDVISGAGIGTADFKSATSLFVDKYTQDVYVVDTGNNRIVVLDKQYQLKTVITDVTANGKKEPLSAPQSVYVDKSGKLYIADTGNNRVVCTDKALNVLSVVTKPDSTLIEEGTLFIPTSVVADTTGRIYVIAENINYGVLQFSPQGKFEGFLGTQKVAFNAIDYFWKQIMTDAQNEQTVQYVPTEYSNMAIDDDGFIYVTASSVDAEIMQELMLATETSPRIAPVKLLNPNGDDILTRKPNIFVGGDIVLTKQNTEKNDVRTGPSIISAIALGDSKTYTLLDSNRNRYFTYSKDGDLLFAFGLFGTQIGTTTKPVHIAYKGSDFLVLDAALGNITRYRRTEFGDMIIAALDDYNNFLYDDSVAHWKEVLKYNSNADIAYIGIGNAVLRQGDYQTAMQYFELANDTVDYSAAFSLYRNTIIEKYILLICALLIVLVIVLGKLFGHIKKRNSDEKYRDKRKTLAGRVLYGFHLIFHPFDGFWDIKHEGRGSAGAATLILALTCLSMLISKMFVPFAFSDVSSTESMNYLMAIAPVLIPVLLWTVANWCITTLLDGDGTMKDIYIATCYSLFPILIFTVPLTVVSFVLTLNEAMYLSFFQTIAYIWTFAWIFFGTMTVHQYGLLKNIVAAILTIVGIGIILFLILVFSSTVQKMGELVADLWKEITFRM